MLFRWNSKVGTELPPLRLRSDALEQAAKQAGKHARTSRRIADSSPAPTRSNRAAALRIGCLVLFNASPSRTVSPPPTRTF